MKKIRELFLIIFCKINKLEECCDTTQLAITNLEQIINQCCESGPDSQPYPLTLFVDNLYGDDSTGERENFGQPYKTIQAAINDSQSGDTVYVRSGIYTENIIFKDKVDFYYEEVIFQGTMSDSSSVTLSIRGGLVWENNTQGGFNISSPGTNITADIEGVISSSAFIIMTSGTELNPNSITLRVKYLRGLEKETYLVVSGKGYAKIFADEGIFSEDTVDNSYNLFMSFDDFIGEIYVKSPIAEVGDSTLLTNSLVLAQATHKGGKIFMEIDRVVHTTTSTLSVYNSCVLHQGRDLLDLKIKDLYTNKVIGIVFNAVDGGILRFEGGINSGGYHAIEYNGSQKMIINNSVIKRTGPNGRNNHVIIIKDNASSQISSGLKISRSSIVLAMSFIGGTSIVPEGIIQVGVLGAIGQSDSSGYLSEVDIIVDIPGSIGALTSIASSVPRSLYMKNVTTNLDKDSDISDANPSTGYTFDVTLPKVY